MTFMALTAAPSGTSARRSERDAPDALGRALLLTLVYSDIFDYPLSQQELRRYLPVACSEEDFKTTLDALESTYVTRSDGLLCLRGREHTFETRRRRAEIAAARWRKARRFASWLRWVPFLRMVAVCGSQAVDNAGDEGDVDLFLITTPGRLWLVQSITMTLRRFGWLRFGIEICPNYLMSRGRLEIENHNLYVAREIAQSVPLWGEEDYGRFLDANRWIERFLPQAGLDERRHALHWPERPRPTQLAERLLGGRLGHLLDRAIHRTLLLYYRARLSHRGWSREDVESAYLPDRQALITGGYAGAVADRFLEHARKTLALTGDEIREEEVRRYFFEKHDDVEADPHFAGIFAQRYGASRE